MQHKTITILLCLLLSSGGPTVAATLQRGEEHTIALSLKAQYRYNALGEGPSDGLGTYVSIQYDDITSPLLVGVGVGLDRSSLLTGINGCTELSMEVGYRIKIKKLTVFPELRFGCLLSHGDGGTFSAYGLAAKYPVTRQIDLCADWFYHINPFTILLEDLRLCSMTSSFGLKYFF